MRIEDTKKEIARLSALMESITGEKVDTEETRSLSGVEATDTAPKPMVTSTTLSDRDTVETEEAPVAELTTEVAERSRSDRDTALPPATHRPTSAQLKEELQYETDRKRFGVALSNTIWVLVFVAAVSVLIAVFFVSVLRVRGDSMAPNLNENELVVSFRTTRFQPGEIVAFYYGPSILLKRVIGSPGDIIEIDDAGNVYVNGQMLEESYLTEKHKGDYSDIEYPYQVPEKRYFVLGDNRKESIDSRSYEIGTVTSEQIVGKVLLRIWPLW